MVDPEVTNLDFEVHLAIGGLCLNAAMTIDRGEVLAVVGPNGAGKTTLLRALAGSLAIDSGHVRLGERDLDREGQPSVPQAQRRIGIVHQDGLLFPHMSAVENVAFGLRARHVNKADARKAALASLERVGAEALAEALPRHLSGGEAQRVALARALAVEPALLLLDEPLSALDVASRVRIRRDLRSYLADFDGPCLLVTHDPTDALVLADTIAILESGSVTQAGTIAEIAAHPRTRYVAELIGTNLVRGRGEGSTLRTESGITYETAESHHGLVMATISPNAVSLFVSPPGGSPRNMFECEVDTLELIGDRVRIRLAAPLGLVAEITAKAASELSLHEGAKVWASVKATEISVF